MSRLIAICILWGAGCFLPIQTPAAQVSQQEQKPAAIVTDPAVALDPQLLKAVKLVGGWGTMTAEESHAYYRVLARARTVDERKLKAAASQIQKQRRAAYPRLLKNPKLDFPAFADLFTHPELYHGRPVTLEGHVRRFVVLDDVGDENDEGIQTLYEAWLFTDDSQGNPAVIVCTSIPDGFPKNEELIDHVSATGYFFKQLVYEAQDDKRRLVPMILAHRLRWRPGETSSLLESTPWGVYLGAAAVFVIIILLLWRSARKDRAYHQARTGGEPETAAPDFTALDPAGEPTRSESVSTEGCDVEFDNNRADPAVPGAPNDRKADPAGDRPSS